MFRRNKNFRSTHAGFTIVELLIVIVVIGVLAAIVIVAYNGVKTQATNKARHTELKAWASLFEAYKAQNGKLPTMATGYYCLGTGFPTGPSSGGVPRCRDYNGTGTTSYPESTGADIMTELSSVGKIPSTEKVAVNGTVGPYLQYTSGSGGNLYGWFNGGTSDCPGGTTYSWTDNNGRVACVIRLLE